MTEVTHEEFVALKNAVDAGFEKSEQREKRTIQWVIGLLFGGIVLIATIVGVFTTVVALGLMR